MLSLLFFSTFSLLPASLCLADYPYRYKTLVDVEKTHPPLHVMSCHHCLELPAGSLVWRRGLCCSGWGLASSHPHEWLFFHCMELPAGSYVQQQKGSSEWRRVSYLILPLHPSRSVSVSSQSLYQDHKLFSETGSEHYPMLSPGFRNWGCVIGPHHLK